MSGDLKIINVKIPEELHTQMKVKAAKEKTTVKDLVIKAMKQYCKDEK